MRTSVVISAEVPFLGNRYDVDLESTFITKRACNPSNTNPSSQLEVQIAMMCSAHVPMLKDYYPMVSTGI
jgi:hypothetical protein